MQGVGDPGTRLMFKFRSGTNGLNEELGRHTCRGKMVIGSTSVSYGGLNVSVVHVLWECPVYGRIYDCFCIIGTKCFCAGSTCTAHLEMAL